VFFNWSRSADPSPVSLEICCWYGCACCCDRRERAHPSGELLVDRVLRRLLRLVRDFAGLYGAGQCGCGYGACVCGVVRAGSAAGSSRRLRLRTLRLRCRRFVGSALPPRAFPGAGTGLGLISHTSPEGDPSEASPCYAPLGCVENNWPVGKPLNPSGGFAHGAVPPATQPCVASAGATAAGAGASRRRRRVAGSVVTGETGGFDASRLYASAYACCC
jgi:hypothetical protein